jgi:hypothetical protein
LISPFAVHGDIPGGFWDWMGWFIWITHVGLDWDWHWVSSLFPLFLGFGFWSDYIPLCYDITLLFTRFVMGLLWCEARTFSYTSSRGMPPKY